MHVKKKEVNIEKPKSKTKHENVNKLLENVRLVLVEKRLSVALVKFALKKNKKKERKWRTGEQQLQSWATVMPNSDNNDDSNDIQY